MIGEILFKVHVTYVSVVFGCATWLKYSEHKLHVSRQIHYDACSRGCEADILATHKTVLQWETRVGRTVKLLNMLFCGITK